MSLHIGILYHWSPRARRSAINRRGLLVGRKSRNADFRAPHICLATTPSSAWSLCVHEEPGPWDLWQVQIVTGDDLEIRGDFAPFVREVRVLRDIPKSRVWWVGERESEQRP